MVAPRRSEAVDSPVDSNSIVIRSWRWAVTGCVDDAVRQRNVLVVSLGQAWDGRSKKGDIRDRSACVSSPAWCGYWYEVTGG